MKQKLCGSFLHFYACKHREARGGRSFKTDWHQLLPGQPYRCGGSGAVHDACPNADHDGARHREAGIVIVPVKGVA